MGIRFLCPNGHALNVKSHLANQRGICPQCQARFLVPRASQPDERVPALSRRPDATVPESAPAAPVAATLPDEPEWHLRLPSGEQFGPAGTVVLQQWIAEGRVSRECHLWRTGWPDWRVAAEVFGDAPLPTPVPASPMTTDLAEPSPEVQSRPSRRQAQLQRARKMRFWLLVALCIAVAGMIPVLIYVLKRT